MLLLRDGQTWINSIVVDVTGSGRASYSARIRSTLIASRNHRYTYSVVEVHNPSLEGMTREGVEPSLSAITEEPSQSVSP